MNLAQYIAKFLQINNVHHIFGLPGGENVPLLDAFRQSGLEFILVHHEAAAGFAADVTGQLNGRPGVCLSTVGPGAVNLLATAISATLERSPVLAITADIDPTIQPHVTHMKADLSALFQAGTKGSFRLIPETAAATLEKAWQLAMSTPCGAVHLSLSPEAAQTQIPDIPSNKPVEIKKFGTPDLEQVRPHLQNAQRLFILAGIGVEASGAQASLLALADAWGTPVAVTPKAKGHFPESHPLFAGCFTAYGDRPLRQALAEADLILGAGLDGVDLVTSNWEIDTPVIILSASSYDPVFQPILNFDGDLSSMLDQVRPFRRHDPEGKTVAACLREKIANSLQTPFPDSPGTIKLHRLITSLRTSLPEDGAVTVDVGAFKLVFLQSWTTDRPKTLFVANGLSAMGYALPGAMAFKLAEPQRPVVAIVGDGALLMYAGELATIAHLNLPILILVVVDEALALIRLKQLRQELPIFGTEFGTTDYQSLANAFGLAYRLIDGRQQASDTFTEALKLNRPVLIEARVKKVEYDHFK